MNNIEDLKQGFLDLVKAELSLFGVEQSQVSVSKNYKIEIEEHLVDMSVFKDKTEWPYSMNIRVYTLDNHKIIFMPTRDKNEEYRSRDDIQAALESHYNEINQKIGDLSKLFLEQISELTLEMTLNERILDSIKHNFQITESLSDVKSWKAKIILGNSIGGSKEERLKIGDFDSVGYTWIGLTTGVIIPVARGDEHHRGGDLIYHLKSKGLIPQDSYYPIFYNHDYVDSNDPQALQAFKVWRKLGGPNILLNRQSHHGEPFQITIDDYIKANGDINVQKGELLPIGKKFIEMLTVVSKLCIESVNDERKEKRLYVECLKTYNYYLTHFLQYPNESDRNVINEIMKAESTGGNNGIKQIEQIFFGFNGFKNNLHNQVRKAINAKFDFERRDMAGVFGDLELANHLLGSL